jgi:stage V sporulation protein D (sporulation-specific penicillin-binding protein)
MCSLLESVVTEGTAKNASVSGYSIGGKTGTSEKIDVFDKNGKRVLDKIVSFVGVAPMDNPQYIVLAALDTPSRETGIYISGGVMAAPTVGAVMERILPYLGVERIEQTQEVLLEDLQGMEVEEAEKFLQEKGLTGRVLGTDTVVTAQIPAPGQSVAEGSQVLLYCGEPVAEEAVTVPDFIGMNRKEAADQAAQLGLYLRLYGNPSMEVNIKVSEQYPAPGTELSPGSTVELKFIDTRARE